MFRWCFCNINPFLSNWTIFCPHHSPPLLGGWVGLLPLYQPLLIAFILLQCGTRFGRSPIEDAHFHDMAYLEVKNAELFHYGSGHAVETPALQRVSFGAVGE